MTLKTNFKKEKSHECVFKAKLWFGEEYISILFSSLNYEYNPDTMFIYVYNQVNA